MFALVDCNNFYVSCERVFNPKLLNKPVAILSNNDGCIIARSNEVKTLGIPMGAPFFQWRDICYKNKFYIYSSNYELYGDMSNRVMTLLFENCVGVEVYSIDEAFLDFSGMTEQRATQFAKQLREIIFRCTGIPVSIGIAPTKTLAKLANNVAKKQPSFPVCNLMDASTCETVLEYFLIESIWGIGQQLSARLKDFNILTAHDLKHANPKVLRKNFSVMVEKIIYELNGTPCLSLETVQPRKQIISSRSFGRKVISLNELQEAGSYYAAIAAEKMRKQDSMALGISVFLQTHFEEEKKRIFGKSCTETFSIPTSNTATIINVARACIERAYVKGTAYRKVGIMLLDLQSKNLQQQDLLTPADDDKQKERMRVLDEVNKRYGKGALFHAAEGIARPWQGQRNRTSACYTTRWDELLKVK